MRNQRSNVSVPSNGAQHKRCSRCRKTKQLTAFYRNPNSICKDCHNRASRITNQVRRAAIAHLIATHQAEYRTRLQTERATRTAVESGGGSDAA
jgi:recombinational DNA repair protein (RecF pathway)